MNGSRSSGSATAALNEHNRFAHIDAMRAAAVMLVVLAHGGLSKFVPGGSGVTIFFSISGFVITFLILREHDRSGHFSIRRFYARRALKIIPPLLIVVMLPTLVWSLNHHIEWKLVGAQLFFSYNWAALSGSDGVLPGSGVVWSLAIEEQFYICFAVVWLGILAWAKRPLLALQVVAWLTIAYVTATRVFIALTGEDAGLRIYLGTDTRIDGIAFGVLTAMLLHMSGKGHPKSILVRRRLSSDSMLSLALIAYIGSIFLDGVLVRETVRYSIQSLAACIAILWGFADGDTLLRRLLMPVVRSRPVQLIGLASYSIYLVHLPAILALHDQAGEVDGPVLVALSILVGLSGGIVLWALLERPVAELSRKFRTEAPTEDAYSRGAT